MSVFLGIDVGTSGTKTLAIDQQGHILAEATAGYPIYHPKPLWSEQDPDDWWNATVKTVKAVVKAAKLKAADVKAIGQRMAGIRERIDRHVKHPFIASLADDRQKESRFDPSELKGHD